MDPITQLNQRIDTYLKKTGMRPTNLGLEINGNSALISRVRAGNVTANTVKLIWDFLDTAEKPKRAKRKAA